MHVYSKWKAAFSLSSGERVGSDFILCDIWPSILDFINIEISLERKKERREKPLRLWEESKPHKMRRQMGCRRWLLEGLERRC